MLREPSPYFKCSSGVYKQLDILDLSTKVKDSPYLEVEPQNWRVRGSSVRMNDADDTAEEDSHNNSPQLDSSQLQEEQVQNSESKIPCSFPEFGVHSAMCCVLPPGPKANCRVLCAQQ